MTIYDTNESIDIENEQREKVESYKYLGQTVKMLDAMKLKVSCLSETFAPPRT